MLLRYSIPRALSSLLRQWPAALSTLLILTAGLAVLGLAALVYLNIEHLGRLWLSRTTVSLFLKADLDAPGREAILERVRNHPLVKSAQLVSPKEGLQALAERLGADSSLLTGIDESNLPWAVDFDVFVDYRQRLGTLARTFRAIPGVEDVVYAERLLDRVQLFFTLTDVVGLVFLGILAAAFCLTIANATLLSLHSRREEIEILDLVGATRGTIRSSFVVEGVVLTLLAVGLALGLVSACYWAVNRGIDINPAVHALQGQLVFLPLPQVEVAAAGFLALAVLSSHVAVTRQLRRLSR